MSIVFPCPSCRVKVKAQDNYAGKMAKCPKCNQITTVPQNEPYTMDVVEEKPGREQKNKQEDYSETKSLVGNFAHDTFKVFCCIVALIVGILGGMELTKAKKERRSEEFNKELQNLQNSNLSREEIRRSMEPR